MSEFILYNTDDGLAEIKLILDNETKTVWLNQKQMSELFDVSVKTVNEHIINIYKESELEENATIRNFRIVQREGSREVEREISHYNLKLILSVGYRNLQLAPKPHEIIKSFHTAKRVYEKCDKIFQ